MNNSIIVPEDKDFVCAFVTSPEELRMCIEHIVNEKNSIKNNNADKKM